MYELQINNKLLKLKVGGDITDIFWCNGLKGFFVDKLHLDSCTESGIALSPREYIKGYKRIYIYPNGDDGSDNVEFYSILVKSKSATKLYDEIYEFLYYYEDGVDKK